MEKIVKEYVQGSIYMTPEITTSPWFPVQRGTKKFQRRVYVSCPGCLSRDGIYHGECTLNHDFEEYVDDPARESVALDEKHEKSLQLMRELAKKITGRQPVFLKDFEIEEILNRWKVGFEWKLREAPPEKLTQSSFERFKEISREILERDINFRIKRCRESLEKLTRPDPVPEPIYVDWPRILRFWSEKKRSKKPDNYLSYFVFNPIRDQLAEKDWEKIGMIEDIIPMRDLVGLIKTINPKKEKEKYQVYLARKRSWENAAWELSRAEEALKKIGGGALLP